MNCIVTAGPTYEPLDEVRRLTNFSTGRLGAGLANFLVRHGHEVTLLLSRQATYHAERPPQRVETFGTTADLRDLLRGLAAGRADAVFHAAAVSDFAIGKIWSRPPQGEPVEIKARKIPTRQGTLLAELVPTPKIIAELRGWYPTAKLVGWKYEADGDRPTTVQLAEMQMAQCRTNACVANGPAYGEGFGLVTSPGRYAHLADAAALFEALEKLLKS
jgi:phosphopantothenate---cysteine ligase (CTP)